MPELPPLDLILRALTAAGLQIGLLGAVFLFVGLVFGLLIRRADSLPARDPDGQLHILRNGQLGDVINFSKGYTNAIVEVGVAYDSNLDQVYSVLGQAGDELKANNPDVLKSTIVQGLNDFGESQLTIRTVTRVKPGRHRPIARQYRKLIKEAFEREGIEIPFERRVVIFENNPPEVELAPEQPR